MTQLASAADAGRIRGRIVDAEGEPVVGATVTVEPDGPSAITDADGRFSLGKIDPGTHTLLARLRDQEVRRPDVDVVEGRTTEIEFKVDWEVGFADTVTVYAVSRSAERIADAPAAVTTVSPEEIKRRAAHGQLPKLLEFTPGVELAQNGLWDFNLNARGFNQPLNRRVLVLVDGRDPSIPLLASQAWPAFSFPLFTIRSAELVRGPASALYGADAFNGVLNMKTTIPGDEPGGTVQLAGGELQTRRADVAWNTPLGREWHMKLTAGAYRSEDWSVSRDVTTEYPGLDLELVPLATDEDTIEYAGLRFDRYFDGRRKLLTLEGGYNRYGGPVAMTAAGRVQVLDNRHPWARAAWSMPHWNFSASYTGRDVRNQLSLGTATTSSVDSHRFDLEAQGNTQFAGEKGRLVGGVQLRRTSVDSADSTGMQTILLEKTTEERYGIYGQVDYRLHPKLKGVLAARFDDSSLYPSQFSPKAGLVYSVTPAHTLRLTYNEAFQAPNFAELLVRFPIPVPGVPNPLDLSAIEDALSPLLDGVPLGFESIYSLAVGNSNLDVEEITTAELGYRGLIGRRLVVDANYYRSELENFVSTLLDQFSPSFTTEPPGRVNPEFGPYQPPAELSDAAKAAVDAALQTALGAFYAYMSNDVDGTPIFAVASYTNVGLVDTEGVELGLDYFVGKRLRINGSYAWFDFEVKDAPPENPILPNAPERKFSLGASYTTEKWDASLQYRWFDDFRWNSGVFVGPVPSAGIVDFYGNWAFAKNWRLGINAANLLDNEHIQIYGGDILRRRVLGQITYTW